MTVLNDPVLILNKNWIAIKVRNVKTAIRVASRGSALIIDPNNYELFTWDDWIKLKVKEEEKYIQAVRFQVKVPEVIILTKYGKIPESDVRLTKRNIFIRDGYSCQYSGKILNSREADIDHIIPKSKGGKSVWNNLVVSSKQINRKKGNRTPKEAGLNLIKKPKKPKYQSIIFDPRKKIPKSWEKFI